MLDYTERERYIERDREREKESTSNAHNISRGYKSRKVKKKN